MPRIRSVWAMAGAAAILAVSACTSSGGSQSNAAPSASSAAASEAGVVSAASAGAPLPTGAAAQTTEASAAAAGAAGTAAPAAGNPDDVTLVDTRQVIKVGTLTLDIPVASPGRGAAADATAETKAVDEAAVKVRALAAGGGGYVEASDGQDSVVSVTLRVGVDQYDSVMTTAATIGTVVSRKETSQDVTSQVVDVNSRVATLKAGVASLQALLSKATKIGDILQIESDLTSRESDLESLEQQKASLADQSALSTVTVVLQATLTGVKVPPVVKPAPGKTGFLGGLASGWRGFTALGKGIATVIGAVLPFLPIALVVAVALLIWRRNHPSAFGAGSAKPESDPMEQ